MKKQTTETKSKVGDLAKELGKTAKEVLKILAELKVAAKTSASIIDAENAALVKALVKKSAAPKTAAPADKPEPKKEPAPVESKEPIKETPPIETKAPEAPVAPITEEPLEQFTEITIETKEITVKDLAEKMQLKVSDLIKELMKKGMMVNLNQNIDVSIVKEIAPVFKFNVNYTYNEVASREEKTLEKIKRFEARQKSSDMKDRPPVVTIMGHVDHGKTKLLDAIRHTNVIDQEAGGITQHIGAYQVTVHGKKVTFLDTPGHEAFTALRARGAKVTDIAVLVVAADDGVKPQTIEAIDHAKAAGVPIIVAINKVDKPDANLDRVKQQLTELGLQPEEWGGQTITVPVSAKFNKNIDQLLEMILLQAEVQELKASPKGRAHAVVVESKLDRGRGPVATVLIKSGTLKVGAIISVGTAYGKVRALISDKGNPITEAPPSLPVEILGLSSVPEPGDLLEVVASEQEARELAEKRLEELQKLSKSKSLSLEDFSKDVKEGQRKDLNIILKADMQGSLEALAASLANLSNESIHIHLLHKAVGAINESDIMLAKVSSSIIIGFHIGFDGQNQNFAEKEGIDVRLYNIIYKATEDITLAMEGLLEPEYEEVVIGHAEVRSIFNSSKIGTIAGCFVKDGKLVRGCKIKVLRDNDMLYEGKLESLKRFKEDTKEVETNFECGISISGYNDFKQGDIIEASEMKEKPRKKLA
ncbi:MAG: translation initiation factor IF-2 [Candidatus Saganbacteria bacterium]|nr:translation initiation factor IF-2 [Candidatus Saganbacteria bacterium]